MKYLPWVGNALYGVSGLLLAIGGPLALSYYIWFVAGGVWAYIGRKRNDTPLFCLQIYFCVMDVVGLGRIFLFHSGAM